MSDALQKLFGSAARVKLLRLFLFNPRSSYTLAEAATRARVTETEARHELSLFEKANLVERAKRGKGLRFVLSDKFEYLEAMQALLLNTPVRGKDITDRLREAGTLKLVIISGVFIGEWDGRLDLLVVGDRINDRKMRERIRMLEAELGKELRYAVLATDQFMYRINMSDKLVRDMLDYPHTIVLDRLNIGLK